METKLFHTGTVGLYEPQPLGLTRVVVPMWGYTAVEYFGNSNMWTNPILASQSENVENIEDNTSTKGSVDDAQGICDSDTPITTTSKLYSFKFFFNIIFVF